MTVVGLSVSFTSSGAHRVLRGFGFAFILFGINVYIHLYCIKIINFGLQKVTEK